MSDIEQDSKLWLVDEMYGFKSVPSPKDHETIIKSVLICSKADGVLAPEERNWIVGRAAALRSNGYELAQTYQADEDVIDVLSQADAVNNAGRRTVIYLAIKTCSADGELHPDEMAKIYQIAEKLGLEKEVVDSLKEICVEEAQVREKRIGLLFPDGAPY
ncbi:TerB family tellurite resistance protein [Okeania sp.]|uniref:TerB family tellurite resistance protein n=1 Tax=Okeania sp. TaxID=3100323 RepID=UPI002B4AC678|nr:TerB family tellurite resistance protein [Okeania sp.]MEB3340239.1 TerB family tellurite resistance protein [Okeania sp.]